MVDIANTILGKIVDRKKEELHFVLNRKVIKTKKNWL